MPSEGDKMPGEGDKVLIENDRTLLDRIARNDHQAFALLVGRYIDSVTRFAFHTIGTADGAEDIAQDVFVRFWEKRAEVVEIKSVKAYLLKLARNRSLNVLKAEGIRDRYKLLENPGLGDTVYDDDPQNVAVNGGSEQNPEEKLLNAATIEAALRQLPERRQLVLHLRVQEGLSHAEIGDIMGISPQAAQVLAGRALSDLRKILGVFDF